MPSLSRISYRTPFEDFCIVPLVAAHAPETVNDSTQTARPTRVDPLIDA
jgi:hypothetical protein